MVGVLLVVPSVAALGLSAWLLASCLRLETLTGLLLTAYLVAWAEVVLGAMALSAFDAFERVGVVGVVATWLLVAAAVWSRGGRPRPVPIGVRARWLARALRNPGAVAYLGVLGAGYAYLVALGLFTPQNDGDPLVYQLTRAALWRQQQGIGIVGVPIEPRLDVNPIVAEVGQATSMILAGSERFVWLVQFAAVAALAVAAFALARRVGLGASAALYGAMLVPALPVIATQAITGLNDLVAASFVVSAAVFALGRERRELVSLTLAAALAVGTKFTTPLLLPVVAFAGALSQPVRRWPALLAAGALGAALGAGWYVVNLARTGEPDGGLAAYGSQEPDRSASAVLLTVQKLVLDSVERPGTG